MNRELKIGLIAVAVALGLVAIGALWSLDYAMAYLVIYRRFDMLNAVWSNHDWLLPAQQVWANFGRSELSRLINLSVLALIVEIAGVGGVIGYFVSERRRNVGPTGGARFADTPSLYKAELLQGVPGTSILLGRFEGKEVRYSGDSHILVNGPTRTGKGRGFLMPNLLEWRGSVIVLDMKLENFRFTGPTRAAMGQQVIVIAPGSQFSHCWNPLDFVRPWPTRPTDVMNLSAALIEEPDRGEKFWAQTARGLLAGLIAYVLESPTMEDRRTMRSVQRLLTTEIGLVATLKAILEMEPTLSSFTKESFRGFLGGDEKQRKSFESSVDTGLIAWKNPLIAALTAKSDFDIRDFRRKGMSVFIASPVSDFATMEPVIRLFIQQIHDLALRELPKADENLKVLLMLDEFYQFKRLPEVVLRAPLVGGYGFKIAVMSQNLPQIDERYGKVTREAFLGNMDIKLFIAANDDTTAETISRDLGRRFDKRVSISERSSFGAGKSVTRTTSWVETNLLSPSNIKQLSDDKTLLLVRGHSGVILDKINFYTDRECRSIVERDAPLQSATRVPALEEAVEWPLFRLAPADVKIPIGGLKNKRGPVSLPVDRESEALWAKIKTGTKLVFQEPTVYLHGLSVAITAIDDNDIVWIAQNLRKAPELCGALRGKSGSVRRKFRREREAALEAVGGLWHATMDLRARIKQERLRVVSPKEGSQETGKVVAQPQAVLVVENFAPEMPDRPPEPASETSVQLCAKEMQGKNEAGGVSGAPPQPPLTEPVEAAASEAAESFSAALAEVVDDCGVSIGNSETQERIAAMREKIRNHVAAFASDEDTAELISPELIPKRVA